MLSFTPQVLSGSVDGKPIAITGTDTAGGVTVHTAGPGTTIDEVFLAVSNVTASSVPVTIEWGDPADPAGLLVKDYSVPANSAPTWIATGQRIGNGVVIRAFAGTADALNLTGYVNRIS